LNTGGSHAAAHRA